MLVKNECYIRNVNGKWVAGKKKKKEKGKNEKVQEEIEPLTVWVGG